jgi:pimeloyl-ACP methyl ester carboxylesterase
MIMGLGAQMIWWDEEICRALADHGLFVIRMDNRDVGLSSKIPDTCGTRVTDAYDALARGESFSVPYTLTDMAADAMGLLDALGIAKAHVCGASMGGMIAQRLAIHYPEKVLSLISIMSHTGNPRLPGPSDSAQESLTTPPPLDRAANIEYNLEAWRVLGSPGFPFDEERVRRKVTECYDRSFYPDGFRRQLLAILADGNRRPHLEKLTIPTLVIHGSCDPLVPPAGGVDTADAVPGARLMMISGMGHDFPVEIHDRLVEAMVAHIRSSEPSST